MTEAEWRAGAIGGKLLAHVADGASERKLYLLAVGWCRLRWPPAAKSWTAPVLGTVERYADGEVTEAAYRKGTKRATDEVLKTTGGLRGAALTDAIRRRREAAAVHATAHRTGRSAAARLAGLVGTGASKKQRKGIGDVIRCVFGNPFRPVTFTPAWLTPTAVGVAQAIYDDRAFDRLPILADALQDAGCEDEQVLAHCRDTGPHARGCWVVDGVLAKG